MRSGNVQNEERVLTSLTHADSRRSRWLLRALCSSPTGGTSRVLLFRSRLAVNDVTTSSVGGVLIPWRRHGDTDVDTLRATEIFR